MGSYIGKALAVAALLEALSSGGTAWAQNLSLQLTKGVIFQQTGETTVTETAAAGSIGLYDFTGLYDIGTLIYPGSASSVSLTYLGTFFGAYFSANVPTFASKATMDAALPAGDYTFVLSNSGTSASTTETLNYTADYYPSDLPMLTPETLAALDHLDLSAGLLTVSFTPFAATGSPTFGNAAFGLYDEDLPWPFPVTQCSQIPSTPGQCTIYLNSLAPGDTYRWQISSSEDFRVVADGAETDVYFAYITMGTVTLAGAPEASTWTLMLAGLSALAFASLRASRRAVLRAA